jgi:hypothetical protein
MFPSRCLQRCASPARRRRALDLEVLEDRLAPSASPILFTLNQGQSSLTFSGTVSGFTVAPQSTGSLTASYAGTLETAYDPTASTLLFLAPASAGAAGTITATNSGSYAPALNGAGGSALANYGGTLDAGFLGTVNVAVRGLEVSLSTLAPQALSGSGSTFSFTSSQTLALIGTSGMDYAATGILASQIGAGHQSLANQSNSNRAGPGTFQDKGNGSYLLTVPVDLTVSTQVNGQTATFSISGSLQASATLPVLDLNGAAAGNDFTTTFVSGAGPVSIVAADASVTRALPGNLTSATIALTNRPDGNAESLSVNVAGSGLSATYDSTSGTLTVTGSASPAVYQQVLRTATYNDTAASPNTADRAITFAVNDGANTSLAHGTTLHVKSAAPAPTSATAVLMADGSLVQISGGTVQTLSPAGTILAISAALDGAGNTDVFAITTAGHNLWEHTATGWWQRSIGSFQSISAATNAAGDAVCFGILSNGNLWEYSSLFSPNTGFFAELSVGQFLSISAVTDSAGNDVVYAITADTNLWQHSPAIPGGWVRVSPGSFQAVSAGLNAAGQAEAFAIVVGGSLWVNNPALGSSDPNGNWALLSPAGASTPATVLAITAAARDEVFATDGNGALWQHTGAGWALVDSTRSYVQLSGTRGQSGVDRVFAVLSDTSLEEYAPGLPGDHFQQLLPGGALLGATA